MTVWGFDRILRVLPVVKNGIKHVAVTELGIDHVRIDIPGIHSASQPGYVAYAYAPTVNKLRPWKFHLFSVNATSVFQSRDHKMVAASRDSSDDIHNIVKFGAAIVVRAAVVPTSSTCRTLIIEKNTGLTLLLHSHSNLLAVIDGPYPQKPCDDILKSEHLFLLEEV